MVDDRDNLTLYVYYKIPAEHSDFFLLAIKKLHRAIALRYPKIVLQQQKRPNPDALNQETWMETYAGIVQAQLEKLLADIAELVREYNLPAERKCEIFINL